MNIVIEQEHINRANGLRLRGAPPNADKCPIALALLSMGYSSYVDPVGKTIDIGDRTFTLPDDVAEWAANFDCNEKVHPFGFGLDVSFDVIGMCVESIEGA